MTKPYQELSFIYMELWPLTKTSSFTEYFKNKFMDLNQMFITVNACLGLILLDSCLANYFLSSINCPGLSNPTMPKTKRRFSSLN